MKWKAIVGLKECSVGVCSLFKKVGVVYFSKRKLNETAHAVLCRKDTRPIVLETKYLH